MDDQPRAERILVRGSNHWLTSSKSVAPKKQIEDPNRNTAQTDGLRGSCEDPLGLAFIPREPVTLSARCRRSMPLGAQPMDRVAAPAGR